MEVLFETWACPYCGEPVTVAVDPSAGDQTCIEDCQVCCRPIMLSITIDASGFPRIAARREDD